MKPVTISFDKKITDVYVGRGQCLTVWADQGTEEKRDAVQIEIRVLPDGKLEVYSDDAMITSFRKWYYKAGE